MAKRNGIEQVWAQIAVKSVDECWEWSGRTAGGIPTIKWKGKRTPVRRIIWAFHIGLNGPEELLDGRAFRTCSNKLCCNPAHLTDEVGDFWSFVDRKGPNDCWPYVGGKRRERCNANRVIDYGKYKARDGKTWNAHRYSWFLTNGPIPDGLMVCHTCDNPPCCNPAHLFLGTSQDNADDMVAKGRQYRIVNDDDVKVIMDIGQMIADHYGITLKTLANMMAGLRSTNKYRRRKKP